MEDLSFELLMLISVDLLPAMRSEEVRLSTAWILTFALNRVFLDWAISASVRQPSKLQIYGEEIMNIQLSTQQGNAVTIHYGFLSVCHNNSAA